MPGWVWLVVAVAMLKCVVAIVVAAASGGQAPSPLLDSTHQYGLLLFAFGAIGIALIAARTKDLRAAWPPSITSA